MIKPSAATIVVAVVGLVTVSCQSDSPTAPDISPAFSHVAGVATGKATAPQYNKSGIDAEFSFTDDGGTLTTTGTATGMNPADFYVSLIYDNRSVPGGPNACEPAIFDASDPDFILPTMFIGVWIVDADGNGTLNAVNTEGGVSYVPLSKIGTISVRLFVAPGVVPRVASGRVSVHPAG